MMNDTEIDIATLMNEAQALPDGLDKIAVLEQAVRQADASNDLDMSFWTRMELIDAATFGGCPEKALVAFAWCRGQVDNDPERFDEWGLLWKHKWIVGSLPSFPQYSREQIMAILSDTKKYYREYGSGSRSIAKLECQIARYMGDRNRAAELVVVWHDIPRDALSDCLACDYDDALEMHSFLGNDREALNTAETLFKSRAKCREVPQRTYSKLLMPLFRLDRLEEAMQYHKKVYSKIASNPKHLDGVASNIIFLSLTENFAKATKLFETHAVWSINTQNGLDRMEFLGAAILLLKLLENSGTSEIKLRLPREFLQYNEKGVYETIRLRQTLEEEAFRIAAAFDHRNGNSHYTELLKARDNWVTKPFPLKAKK